MHTAHAGILGDEYKQGGGRREKVSPLQPSVSPNSTPKLLPQFYGVHGPSGVFLGLMAASHAIRRLLSSSSSSPGAFHMPFATTFPLGLTGSGTTDSFYTPLLDLTQPLLQRGSGDFMTAARADARVRLHLRKNSRASAEVEASVREHLAGAALKSELFKLSGEVHDREEMRALLEGNFKQTGRLALLLGGKSVGKSLLLSKLTRRTDIVGIDGRQRSLVYVDARVFGTDLCAGMEEALTEELEGRVALPASPAAALSPMQRNLASLTSVVAAHAAKNLYLCLIVDEANLALPMNPAPSVAAAATKQLLERLVQLTKQSSAINVLLVTSDHAYPYRLRHDGFFTPSNLSEVFIACEVPPAPMRTLLTTKWGLGPRLSDVLLAYCGGHVHLAANALGTLSQRLDTFRVEELAPEGEAGAISRCLEEGGGTMEGVLREVAVTGFAPVAHEGDACAQALARANLGGLVGASAAAPGIPAEARTRSGFGIVPASHFTRHLIAKELNWAGAAETAATPPCIAPG